MSTVPRDALLDLPTAGAWGFVQIVPAPRLGVSQNINYNAAGGAAVLGSVFGSSTSMVQVGVKPSATATGVRIDIGLSPNASATSALVPCGALVYYRVYPGETVSVISDDANVSAVNVVECTTRT